MILGFTYFEFCCNILYYIEFFVFLNGVLTRRFNRMVTYPAEVLCAVIILAVSTFFPKMSIFRLLALPVQLMIINLILFRDKPLRSIFSAWLVLVVIIMVEYLGVAAFFPQEVLELRIAEAPMRAQFISWFFMMVSAALFYWLIALVMNRVRNRLGLREMLMYMFFPVSQILLLYGWMNAMRLSGQAQHQQMLILSVVILCLVADVGLFASMYRVSRQIELERENELLSQQIQAQKSHYSELTAQFDSIRRMRHDIAKHISAMDSLLSAGRSEEAAAYIAELQERPYDASLGICEHPVVDAYLHNAILAAKESNVTIRASVSIPKEISIPDTELVCTFGNLLENAMEACIGHEASEIQMESYVSGGCLFIRVENPTFPETERKVRIPGLNRGVGLQILKEIAKKYDGDLRLTEQNGRFLVEIIYRLEVR